MQFLNHPIAVCLTAAVAFALIMWAIPAVVEHAAEKLFDFTPTVREHSAFRGGAKQRGTVLLGKSYKGYAQGTVVQLATQEETALIAQGIATNTAAPVTPGAVTTTASTGRIVIAAGAGSVVLTNPMIDANSKIFASINQAAADGTLTSIQRVVPAAGSVTFFGNAAATAAVPIDWLLHMVSGELPPQS